MFETQAEPTTNVKQRSRRRQSLRRTMCLIRTCRLEAPVRDFQVSMILFHDRDAGGAYDEREQ